MTARTGPRDLAFTSYLRVLAMAAVVLIHTLTAIVGNDEIRGSGTWLLGTFINRSASWAVPLFVMVSGALLLAPVDGQSPTAFYRRRLHRIAIPLVAAITGYFILRALLGETLTIELIVRDLLAATVYTHLYFFWIVLGLYVVTPVLRAFISDHPARGALGLGIAALGFTIAVTVGSSLLRALGTPSIAWQPPMLTLWIPYLGYFVLGYALRDAVVGRRALWLVALVFVASIAVTAWEYMFATDDISTTILGGGYIGIPVAASTIALFIIGRGLIGADARWSAPPWATGARFLGDLTLGVFIIHMAVLRLFWAFVPGFSFAREAESLPRSLVLWALVLALSFLLTWVISRIPALRRTIGF